MIDSFVLLTPILMIGVVGLLVFVGCDVAFGLHRVATPQGIKATTRSQRVDLSWSAHPDASEYRVYRNEGTADPVKIGTVMKPSIRYRDTDGLVDGMEYLYQVSLVDDGEEGPKSDPVSATPNPINFVDKKTLTTVRNDFTGSVGMAIKVADADPLDEDPADDDLVVVELGRAFGLGNMQTHKIKIVDASNNAELGSVILDTMQLPRSIGDFQYAPLNPKVTLAAGGTYYVLSAETIGGDSFYRHDATVITTDVAVVQGAAFEQAGVFALDAPPPMVYPVDLKY